MRRGVFVVFEGVEGCGKTTQARLLHDYLRGRQLPCRLVRDPGTTAIGERIRTVLLDPASRGMHARTELLLYLASRSQLVSTEIRPALAAREIVISDRFSPSSLAYQGAGRGLGVKTVARLDRFATGNLRPDIVFLLDLDVGVGAARNHGDPDRLESEHREFHERIRTEFLRLARRAPGRYRVLDARRSPDDLHAEVRRQFDALLVKKGAA